MSLLPPSTADCGQLCPDSVLMDVKQVASLLRCSQRHIYRLCDANEMPQPIRLRSLVRWSREQLEAWVADGCPALTLVEETGGDRDGM